MCDAVPEEEVQHDEPWDDGPNFTSWHLRQLLRLVRTLTMLNNIWLSTAVAQEAFVHDADLPAWAEDTLQPYVEQHTRTDEQRQGYSVAWLVSISRSSVFRGPYPYPDLVGFSEWLHKLLAHFPNLGCLLGSVPSS